MKELMKNDERISSIEYVNSINKNSELTENKIIEYIEHLDKYIIGKTHTQKEWDELVEISFKELKEKSTLLKIRIWHLDNGINKKIETIRIDGTIYYEFISNNKNDEMFLLLAVIPSDYVFNVKNKIFVTGLIYEEAIKNHLNLEYINKYLNTSKEEKHSQTYLMKDGSGYTKIGRSINPQKRERTLQSEAPTIVLLAVCDDDIETLLHSKYNKYRIRGEWFNLSDKQVGNIIDKYNFKLTL